MALREASYNYESFLQDIEVDLQDLSIFDAGDLDDPHTISDLRSSLRHGLDSIYANNEPFNILPIILGGEHSLSPPVLNHLVNKLGPNDTKIGVLYLDAHLDMRDSYFDTKWSHACSARRITEIVGAENVISVGVRSWSREEAEFLENELNDEGFRFYPNTDVFDLEPSTVGESSVEHLINNGCQKIYVTIDMDVFDPSIAPGVGNPEPEGLTYSDVLDILEPAIPYLCGVDLVEVNPLYDHGITALMGARLIRQIIGMHYDIVIR